MKKNIAQEGWQIRPFREEMKPHEVSYSPIASDSSEEWTDIGHAWSVQEALIEKGLLSGSILEDGQSDYCNWIGNTDWIYRCFFDAAEPGRESRIHFTGVDTVADIFLNGEYLGHARSMYKDWSFPAEGLKSVGNELILYFHGRKKMLDYYEEQMLPHWKGNVRPEMMLRKGRDYGAAYGYSPIGLCGPVYLEQPDKMELVHTDLDVDFNLDHSRAVLRFTAECAGEAPGAQVCFFIKEPGSADEASPIEVKADVKSIGGVLRAEAFIEIENPRLWWPKNYGDQPIYDIGYRLELDGEILDELRRKTGLRHVEMVGDMRFRVNGTDVYLWGSGITPIHGLTNRYRHDTAMRLVRRLAASNMNAVRIWGPGRPYPDDFYNALDAAGIMVWQDFPTGTWQMPDSPEYQSLYGLEAEYMIRRLKIHPCIMLYCGGNEHIYMCELDGLKSRIGFDMLHYGYREICNRLDPRRYYHVSSPYGGPYTNDLSVGDSHGSRAFGSYTPGEDYGHFLSEDIRVFPPRYESMVRFMKEDIWDDSYVDIKPFGVEHAMPKGWKEELGNNGQLKLGPIDEYYSAENPRELIYKYSMAASQDLYAIGARARTGNPPHKAAEKRQCTGHLFWKFNDPWPRFYCSFLDYYEEHTLPFYAVNRAFSPLMIYIQVTDRIYIWAVNDTRKDFSGTAELRVFDINENQTEKARALPAAVPAGKSVLLGTLDDFGPIRWASVVYASLKDADGTEAAPPAHAYVTKENMLPFPAAELELNWDGSELTIKSDSFARCVELSGDEDGSINGWYFSDNYFDLLPFEERKITIDTEHKNGIIKAKAHYSPKVSKVEF